MATSPFQPQAIFDQLSSFEKGMNSNLAPLLLTKNQLAMSTNVTVRGTFVGPRAALRKIEMDFLGDTTAEAILTDSSLWQAGQYYKPDTGQEQLAMVLGGRLFILTPDTVLPTATVVEKTITTPAYDPNPPLQPIAWLWQAENYLIWTDALSKPVFYNGTTSVRSNGGGKILHNTLVATAFLTPAIGTAFVMNVNSTAGMTAAGGDILTLTTGGQYLTLSVIDGTHVNVVNQSALPLNSNNPVGRQVLWSTQGVQLPPGRMGVYVMGRNVMSLVDGRQFVISDQVGGSSGTQALDYRDAVLNITENTYLAGGGNFAVPGSVGDIRAIVATANLDASLGQGPALIITPFEVFSVNLPTDRLTWQDIQNPILAVTALANGGLGQDSTISVNSDTLMRALDGIRSLMLARKDFSTWGNTPISTEMARILPNDITTLLRYSSAVNFDNRMLMTCIPQSTARGVIFRGLVALNFDPISSLQGKAESVYDGLWTGLDILRIVKGEFTFKERCFAFTMNQVTQELELYEILPSSEATADNIDGGNIPITWSFETPLIFGEFQRQQEKPTPLRLQNGEFFVDDLKGRVDFQVYYRPDSDTCWHQWKTFSICQTPDTVEPGYRQRVGLGQPPTEILDPTTGQMVNQCDSTGKPFQNGFWHQLLIIVTGSCSIKNMRFGGITIPEVPFAPPMGCCPGDPTP
jgi:hypothetical protein